MAKLGADRSGRKTRVLLRADAEPGNPHGHIEAGDFDALRRKHEADRKFGTGGFSLAASLEKWSDSPPSAPQDEQPKRGNEDGFLPSPRREGHIENVK